MMSQKETRQMDINNETIEIAELMKELFENYRKKLVKREDADSLANIAGKRLRSVQVNLTNRIYESALGERLAQKTPKLLSES